MRWLVLGGLWGDGGEMGEISCIRICMYLKEGNNVKILVYIYILYFLIDYGHGSWIYPLQQDIPVNYFWSNTTDPNVPSYNLNGVCYKS